MFDENREMWSRLLSEAVKQCASAIIITDTNGTIVFANPRFAELTGYSPAEVQGLNPRILKSGETSNETYEEMWKAIREGKTWRGEVKNKRKDGSLYWANLTVAPVKSEGGEVTHYIGIEEDITKHTTLENQLRAANEELIHSNGELKQFTTIASHDLKAPLSTIASALGLLREFHGEVFKGEAAELISIAAHQADKMLLLLTDLLSYTRAGARKAVHEQVDLNSVIEAVKQNLNVTLFERNGSVESSSLPTIVASRTLMTLLLQNLVENGLKYCTNEAPRVSVYAKRDDVRKLWEVSVSDNGIGFAIENAEMIFEPFTRLPTEQKFPGTGLGLATCRRIVEIFGGTIRAESSPGVGSTFSFTIPFEKEMSQ